MKSIKISNFYLPPPKKRTARAQKRGKGGKGKEGRGSSTLKSESSQNVKSGDECEKLIHRFIFIALHSFHVRARIREYTYVRMNGCTLR